MSPTATWNSLEVVKLIVAAPTPLAVAALGWWLSRQLKRFEHLQWASQKAVEKRLEVLFEPLLQSSTICIATLTSSVIGR